VPEVWNEEYASSQWAHLEGLSELPRYSVLAGYISHLKPDGAVLDVGCGEGVLLSRLAPHGYSRYVGIDASANAIARFAGRRSDRIEGCVADAESYVPAQSFDIIVFNEVLYYFHQPQQAVERYARFLSKGGILLVSICTAAKGAAAILKGLKATFAVLDETRVTHGSNKWSWVCTVFAPDR